MDQQELLPKCEVLRDEAGAASDQRGSVPIPRRQKGVGEFPVTTDRAARGGTQLRRLSNDK